MSRGIVKWSTLIVLCVVVLSVSFFVLKFQWMRSSSNEKIYRIGVLARGSGVEAAIDAYQIRLLHLGYIKNKNITYDIRFITDLVELERAANYFVEERFDLIHTYATPPTKAAYVATRKHNNPIPIVFGSMGDPLITGMVLDISRPGLNVTGVTSLSTELMARRIELLMQIAPHIKRIAFPHSEKSLGDLAADRSKKIAEDTAKELGVELIFYPIHSASDNKIIAAAINHDNADAIAMSSDSLVVAGFSDYVAQAKKEKLPLAAFNRAHAEQGALISFGPDYAMMGVQAANMTHQILLGKNPADIAIQVPEKLQLMVNLDTAREIEFHFDDAFLKTADIIIGGL